jgi:phosphatidylserine/phosphatidylglycerophosphate/cardiolipin synthase-like enzyme
MMDQVEQTMSYLGSHNLTQSALRHNNALSVLVDSPELVAEVNTYLERL